jgi:HptB-dependent secretion and biofilm anti anti-sigma factor
MGQSITLTEDNYAVERHRGNLMQTTLIKEGAKAVIKLSGRFDFNAHREFRTVYEPLVTDASVTSVLVDFSEVDYLDSSALGMLLMLRDKLGGVNKEAVKGNVKQVLDIANFGKLFKIS